MPQQIQQGVSGNSGALGKTVGDRRSNAASGAISDNAQAMVFARKQNVSTVDSFKKEIAETRSTLQVATSAIQELAESLSADPEKLNEAGERAKDLLASIKRDRTSRQLDDIRSKLSRDEPASFSDVVEAVAVLAQVSGGTDIESLQAYSEAVSLVNEALSKAQKRIDSLEGSVAKVSEKAERDVVDAENIAAFSKGLARQFTENSDQAFGAQANMSSDEVARLLGASKEN